MPTQQQQAKTNTSLSPETQKVIDAFNKLGTDDKLALLYYAYEEMGEQITPAAPSAAEPELAPKLLGDYLELSDDEQLQIMRDIAEKKDTEWSRLYGGLKANNQLVVWYSWAQEMGNKVVDFPQDYKANSATNKALENIEKLEFEQQISFLRQVASEMGYSEVKPTPTQQETGKTPSL
ncbi:orange carotenoid protein N-terminal domain-containing protein [Oscillatoria salina]|uniref:orange carotenoid protein N-terminal domain-containing protein n=1 Tax=Oscillatoria salina TaxID=331517 RepID=UPI0013B95113|nr:orange carotenoid protein N-terminal domain-containing protein [Oscillatoria salina]MBZ8179871.1 orange carotenoid protein [Oscillatoria salina IIICB1]NET88887.1 orange carotenoid protein [Kamptonema sp. SIO1D9]